MVFIICTIDYVIEYKSVRHSGVDIADYMTF